MKTVLPMKHLLRTLFLCLFCCASLPALAQGDDDDDKVSPSYPPKRDPGNVPSAAVVPSAASLIVIFLEYAEESQLEVCTTDGTPVFIATGAVSESSRIELDTRRWKRGSYIVRVKVKGKPVNIRTIQLQ